MRLSIQVAFFLALAMIFSITIQLQPTFSQEKQKTLFTVQKRNSPEAALLKALGEPIDVDYARLRFGDVANDLSRNLEFSIVIHESAIDNNLDEETVITAKATDGTVAEVIQEIVAPYRCTLIVKNDIVWITSRDFSLDNLEIRVYDCQRLLADDLDGDTELLLSKIQENVDRDSWLEVGGWGTISEFDGALIVAQTFVTHAKIEHYLRKFRM